MSIRSIHEVEPVITENLEFQNKSLQGKIFCESIANCLNGDDDLIDLTEDIITNEDQEKKYMPSNNIQNTPLSQAKVRINECQISSLKDYNYHQQISTIKQINSEEISRINNTDIKKSGWDKHTLITTKEVNNSIPKEHNVIEKSRPSFSQQKSQKNDFNIDIRNNQSQVKSGMAYRIQIQQKIGRKSIENYEKAINIINNAMSKSMNRVQRINKHIKKFLYLLKIRNNNRIVTIKEQNEYKLINDQTFFVHSKITDNLFNKQINKFYNILNIDTETLLFMPTNKFRIYWDLLQTIYTYLFIYIYSILIFFAMQDQDSSFIKQYYQYTYIFFLVDILIIFNTAYFKKDVIITNRKQIVWKYLSSSVFLADAICLATMGLKLIQQNSHLVYNPDNSLCSFAINLLVFFKLKSVNQKKKQFSFAFTLKDYQKHIIKLFNQLFIVISVAHIVSLAWHILALYENQNGYSITWIQKYNFDDLTYLQLYLYSMYWSVTTMTTVGYGDISASNYIEALFVTISMILFSCVFAYSINNIGFILQEIEKSSKVLNDNISIIQRYLKRKNVNMQLQCRVRHYLCFLAKELKDRNQQQEKEILQILSNKLRNEIIVEVNSRFINNNTIFSANFSSQSLRKLVFIMEEVIVSPNEIIFEKGDYDDQSIYFIESGQIEIYETPPLIQVPTNQNIKPKTHSLKIISSGNIFGEISFFSSLPRNSSARSLNLSTIYKIDRNKFMSLLKENQEDFERFKMMEEQIKVLQDNTFLHLECFLCKNQGHFAKDCPQIHQKFDSQFIILRHNFSLFQERSKQIKRSTQNGKINARILLKQNKVTCKNLKDNIRYFNSQTEIYYQTDKEIDKLTFETQELINQDLQTSTEQTSQSSFKQENSNIYINQNQIFKSERNITPTNKDQQHNSHLKVEKSQIQIAKSMNQIKNYKESLLENQNLDNLEDLFAERLSSMNINNQTKIKSIDYIKNCKHFQKDGQINNNYQNSQQQKEHGDQSENVYCKQEFCYQNSETADNQSNFSKPQNQKILNIQKLTNSSQSDSSQVSIQETEEKIRNKSNKLKTNQIIQEDNISNNTDEQDNFNKNQVSNTNIKKQKKVQQTLNFVRPSIDYSLNSGIYSSYFNQSMEFNNAQNQVKLDKQVNKLQEEQSSPDIINKKSYSSYENNSFQQNSKRNTSDLITQLSKQSGNQEQLTSGILQLSQDQIKKNEDQNKIKSKFTLNNLDVQRINTQIFLEKSNQNIIQKICNMLSKQGSKIFNIIDQQQSEFKIVSHDFILNNFDKIKNFKKFFPHNNFCNFFENSKKINQLKLKRKINSPQAPRHRRQNNIFIKQNSVRKSLFFNQLLQNQKYSLTDYEKCKPSFLSYGVSQKNDINFPIMYKK